MLIVIPCTIRRLITLIGNALFCHMKFTTFLSYRIEGKSYELIYLGDEIAPSKNSPREIACKQRSWATPSALP